MLCCAVLCCAVLCCAVLACVQSSLNAIRHVIPLSPITVPLWVAEGCCVVSCSRQAVAGTSLGLCCNFSKCRHPVLSQSAAEVVGLALPP